MSIRYNQVEFEYSPGTPFAYGALKGIDLTIEEGKITAIIGATGSGKTTLVQHLNALLLPTKGTIDICNRTISSEEKPKRLKSLRKEVGLVFQFPEYQLFEETILKDVAFGPMNFQVPLEEANAKAKEMIRLVGLDDSYIEKSPLDLSGGQKRRVAIAGILAMDPSILVLDEPTAGLDPQGSQYMMNLFMQLHKQYNKTIIMVTHDMEHVLRYADEVVVMKDGQIHIKQAVNEFFKDIKLLKELNINPPAVVKVRELLNQKGFHIPTTVLDIQSLAKSIKEEIRHE